MKRLLLIFAIMIGFAAVSRGAESETVPARHVYVGAYGHLNFNFHHADFSALPGLFSCCPKFESGSGIGPAFGILAEFPLKPKLFLGARLGYSVMNGKLTRDEVIGNTYAETSVSDPTTQVKVEHSIDGKLACIAIEPQVIYNFFNHFTGSLGLKGTILTTKNFTQKEKITSPNNVVFKNNGQTSRTLYNDVKIPDAKSFVPALTLGAAYNFALSNGLLIAPEARFEVPFTNITSVSWKVSTLAAGVAVKYPLIPQKKIPSIDSVVYLRDTTMIATENPGTYEAKMQNDKVSKRKISYEDHTTNLITHEEHYSRQFYQAAEKPQASIALYGVNSAGEVVDMPQLTVEEVEASETFPLLPYIFFNNAGADITTSRVNLISESQARGFRENELKNWDALAIYRDVLNIIGSRLQNNPNAKITITGCNSNTGVEEGNADLSRRRAEAVAEYFKDSWNIDSKRMTVETRNLPQNPASSKSENGNEENRRTEISSTDAKILAPITLSEIHKTANPPIVRITPKASSSAGIDSWNIDLNQGSTNIRSYNGKGDPESVDWTVETLPVPLEESPVSAKLSVKDNAGKTGEAENTIKIEQKTIRKKQIEKEGNVRIDRFSLILFDYDKSDVSDAQNAQINVIKSAIKPNSTVTVTGYTDILTGDKAYNKQLALQRAQNVAAKLGISSSRVKVVSAGGEIGLYDNKLPEGRNLSRTVKVVIATPED